MDSLPPDRIEQIAARVTRLEELIAHFERTLDDLDESIRLLFKRMDTVERHVERLLTEPEPKKG